MAEALDQIVDEGDELLVLMLQMHQMWLDWTLHGAAHEDGVWPHMQGLANDLRPRHGSRQGDFL